MQTRPQSKPGTCSGGGHLEFVVAVIVVGVLLAVFLSGVTDVQDLAQDAQAATASSQARAISALNEARAPLRGRKAASAPPAHTLAQEPLKRAVP